MQNLMNKQIGVGLLERAIYTAVLALAMKFVAKDWIDVDTAIYIAVTAQGLPSLVWGWWINRPNKLLDAAGAQLPKSSQLVITTPANAPREDVKAAQALAASAGDKIVANTSG